ncbi:MAG: hypothetical protein HN489_01305, partial [Opitutae bacterium]|nr:hypothetical protein [Opitutae bacterium]
MISTYSTRLINLFPLLGFALLCQILVAEKTKPNILWMTSEDNSIEWISCYG